MLNNKGRSSNRSSFRIGLRVRKLACLFLAATVLFLSVPPATAGPVAKDAFRHVKLWAGAFPNYLEAAKGLFGTTQSAQLPIEMQPRPQIFPPEPPQSRASREARVEQLRLNVARIVTLRSGQQTTFSALAMDNDGEVVQGVPVRWESSDRNVIFVRPDGRAIAGNPGKASVNARAGNSQESIQVVVLAADISGDVKVSTSQTGPKESVAIRRAHGTSAASLVLPQGPPELPQGDVATLYERRNAVGSPPNRFFPSATTSPAANRNGREMPGSDNYSFTAPITGLPGRGGIDVSLALSYNGSLWHKTGISGNNVTFNVDASWPVAGFRVGYGHLSQRNGGSLELVDPDGTRHQMLQTSPYNATPIEYTSTDGTFIHSSGYIFQTLVYTDGTQVYYGGTSYNGVNVTFYPTRITDRHGNYLSINYQANANGNQIGPRISTIFDTLGRVVQFHYDGNNNLVTITAPGYAGGAARQEIRFYYDTIADFTNSAKFASNMTVVGRPSSLQVLKYVFYPGTQMGYQFDYSPYGMIRQITQLRGMTVTSTSISQTGQVNPGAQVAATTTYNYPSTTPPAGLTAAPIYTQRTDDWAGRTSAMPVTLFEVGQTTKITAPDGSFIETSSDETGDTTETKRTSPLGVTTTYTRTKIEWETDVYGQNRRLKRVQSTIDVNQTTEKTRTIGYTYTNYNNIDEVIEYDFNTAPDTPGSILRRTKTTYVTDAAYTNRRLVRLPSSVQVFAGTSTTPVSRVEYAYDQTTLVEIPHAGQDFITNYDESYDPYAPPEIVCDWVLNNPDCDFGSSCPPSNHYPCCPAHWECFNVPVYDPATAKRGNVTTITSYADAATPSQASFDTMTYDIAGNTVTESANCCQQRSYVYSLTYQYAYVEAVTSGVGATQLTGNSSFDYNTGLLRTSTDENIQTTTFHYDAPNLRLYETVRPDGGVTDNIYFGDVLWADPDAAHMHSAVMSITSLDSTRTVRGWQFSDGQGNVVRTFGENAGQGHIGASYVEYDLMGRLYRASNPYYAIYGGGTDVNPTGYWTTYAYDDLGRSTMVTLQDGNTVQTGYAGVTTTFTDQAGKQRRRTQDALRRLVQLDEPTSSGALTQSTTYKYDVLNNLIKITQGTEQQRYFKYDSLSRLTHERQVEQDAPYPQSDPALPENSYWSRKIAYNQDNLVTDVWDARGIQTHYTYDGSNRVSQVTYTGEPATTTTPTVTYTYDEQRTGYFNGGRLTTVSTAAGGGTQTPVPQTIQALDYDKMGRVQSQRQTVGTTTYTLGYAYNLLGQLQSETYPLGRVVTTTYDAASRLSGVSDATQTFANSFAYATHGALASETWGNGAIHTMTYNKRLQVEQIKLAIGGVERQKYDYKYGEVNVDYSNLNISAGTGLDTSRNTGQVAVIEGSIDGARQWQQRIAYDKLDRLSSAKELTDNQTQTGVQAWRSDYTYDRWGNRYQVAGQGGVPVADADIDKTRNRFVTVGSTLMIYDAAGNLTIDQKFRGMQFTYDANGRMRRTDATNGYTTAVYDGLGLRVQTTDSLTGVTRQSVYDAFGRVVADYENGAWKRDDVYRGQGGVLLATLEASGGLKYLMTDLQGSTRAVVNNTQIVERHDYKPFGEEIGSGTGLRTSEQGYSAQNPVRQQFGLTEKDISSGLNHTLFRKLDSSSGRWTSPDPYRGSMDVMNPQSLNRYTYVENDPANRIDPSGLWWAMTCRTYCGDADGDQGTRSCQTICSYSWVEDAGAGMGGNGGGTLVGGAHGGGRMGEPRAHAEPGNSQRCLALIKRMLGQIPVLNRIAKNYDPVKDFFGGSPYSHQTSKGRVHGVTKPRTHYSNFQNAQRGLRNALEAFKRECMNGNDNTNPNLPDDAEYWSNYALVPPYDPNATTVFDSIMEFFALPSPADIEKAAPKGPFFVPGGPGGVPVFPIP